VKDLGLPESALFPDAKAVPSSARGMPGLDTARSFFPSRGSAKVAPEEGSALPPLRIKGGKGAEPPSPAAPHRLSTKRPLPSSGVLAAIRDRHEAAADPAALEAHLSRANSARLGYAPGSGSRPGSGRSPLPIADGLGRSPARRNQLPPLALSPIHGESRGR